MLSPYHFDFDWKINHRLLDSGVKGLSGEMKDFTISGAWTQNLVFPAGTA
jgi:hypothetical protein